MTNKQKAPQSFGKKIVKYRIKIALAALIILVPIAFIVALYVGDYVKNSSVTFDEEVITKFLPTTITIEETTNHEEINFNTDDLLLKLKLKSIIVPEYIDETGNYTFRIKYSETKPDTVINLEVTMILSTDWYNATSSPKRFNPSTSYSSPQVIAFNHMLPHSPLWFVNVERPNLYVKVKYSVPIALGHTQEKVFYFKTNLTKLTPSDVIDSNK